MDIFRKSGAKAIWIDKQVRKNCYLRFQTKLHIEREKDIIFYLCADTNYELYVNGKLAGFGQYADYPREKVYDNYDIKEYLLTGDNLISILAYSQGVDSSQRLCGIPMVIFTAVAGEKCVLVSDESTKCSVAEEFRSGETEWISYERPFNIGFDLRRDNGWRREYVSADWENAYVVADDVICYKPRPIQKLQLTEMCSGEVVTQGVFQTELGNTVAEQMQYAAMSYRDKKAVLDVDETGVLRIKSEQVYWITDLGKETAGYFFLDLEAKEGAVLDIAVGEHLEDLRVRAYVGERNYGFRCVCREGRQQIGLYMQRFAGRFLQFFAHAGIEAIHCSGLHAVRYPLPFEKRLKTGDRLFDKICEISVETLKLCMFEHYEDCPQREQSLYAFDGRNQMLAGYYVFGETQMPRASLELLGKGQQESGLLEITAPARYERTIPNFSLAWIRALKEYTMFSGDVVFAEQMLPVAEKILQFFDICNKDGVLVQPQGYEHWNFYDWMPGMSNCEENNSEKQDALLTAFYALALEEYGELCSKLGKSEEQHSVSTLKAEIKRNFHEVFFCPKMQAYRSYVGEGVEPHFAQLTQAVSLLADLVPEEVKENIRKTLLSDELVGVSLSSSVYKYDALMQEPEKYKKAVMDDIEKQWGYMLYNGATSFWETVKGANAFLGAASLCHGWSAVPAYIFGRYLV